MNELFRKGDEVVIRGTVGYDQPNDAACLLIDVPAGGGDEHLYLPAECVTLASCIFKPGDFACDEDGKRSGEVVAVSGDFVWVQRPGFLHRGWLCSRREMRRIPRPAEERAEVVEAAPPAPEPEPPLQPGPWCEACGSYHAPGNHIVKPAPDIAF